MSINGKDEMPKYGLKTKFDIHLEQMQKVMDEHTAALQELSDRLTEKIIILDISVETCKYKLMELVKCIEK